MNMMNVTYARTVATALLVGAAVFGTAGAASAAPSDPPPANPLADISVEEFIGSLDKVTDALKPGDSLAPGTGTGTGAGTGAGAQAPGQGAPLLGGLPVGAPIGG